MIQAWCVTCQPEVDTEHEIPDANALDGLDSDDDHEVEKEYSGNADGDESDEGSDSDEYGSMSTSIIKEELIKTITLLSVRLNS